MANIPFPQLNDVQLKKIGNITLKIVKSIQATSLRNETSPIFESYKKFGLSPDIRKDLNNSIEEINRLVTSGFNLGKSELSEAKKFLKQRGFSLVKAIQRKIIKDLAFDAKSLISYYFGLIIGRWNITFSTDENRSVKVPNPFDQLLHCPTGMLQNANGLPANPKDVPADYPLRISWSGIIVDDEGHIEDIVTRVREAIEVIWNDKAEEIEQETCEILGVRSLREYLTNPIKFFADHLKRYSKSRRQAPIYWPLSTASGSYTLWLNYHRLTDQTLYTCINDFVEEPKLKQISEAVAELSRKASRSLQEEKKLEKLADLEIEIKDFRDELLRIAEFWKPNQNDGVQITAAPLWKLFQHKPWQKKLKETWKKLEEGDYDWSHLAYSIWPDRVIRASHKDRSYAIAHDLESDLWEEIENGTDRQGNPKYKWVPKDLSEQALKAIIMEKSKGKT